MSRLLWLADVARTTGYPVVEQDGWKNRGDDTMNPRPLGGMYHHTAGKYNDETELNYPSLDTVTYGRPDLNGPLAHYGVGFDGTIYVVASGKANHAGEGEWPGIAGNTDLIGVEPEHPGDPDEPWPWQQRESVRGLFAAVAHHLDYPAVGTETINSFVLIGHKEWAPDRKSDPVATDMDEERAITNSYKGNPDMPISEETIAAISEKVTADVLAALTSPITKSKVGEAIHRYAGAYVGEDQVADNFQRTILRIEKHVKTLLDAQASTDLVVGVLAQTTESNQDVVGCCRTNTRDSK